MSGSCSTAVKPCRSHLYVLSSLVMKNAAASCRCLGRERCPHCSYISTHRRTALCSAHAPLQSATCTMATAALQQRWHCIQERLDAAEVASELFCRFAALASRLQAVEQALKQVWILCCVHARIRAVQQAASYTRPLNILAMSEVMACVFYND